MIDIKGLDKAAVLMALHNGTRPLGMGMLHNIGNMTIEQARKGIERCGMSWDYCHGRPLKVDISGNSFDEWAYDRDAGQGAAQRAIDGLLESLTRP